MANETIQICQECGTIGHTTTRTKGSLGLEILLWLFFFVPGLFYSIWRRSSQEEVCDRCAGKMIPVDTPRGQMLMQQYYPPSDTAHAPAKTLKPKATHTYSYFYSVDGTDSGPHSLGQMLAFRHSGTIADDTLVVREGDKEWRMLSEFPELSGQ
ncbi:MAG TPA: DUF4339 domain-containing protein [Verrucomicrobiae bacterium]|nr:DUF4339 domain-containing protein [Verrucomicrobiae bacterium]